LTERDEEGCTLLYLAIRLGLVNSVQALLEKGASVKVTDKKRSTPLHCAIDYNQAEIAQQLLVYQADPTVKDNKGCTPLHWAACYGDSASLNVLLSSPFVDIEARAKNGWTALHWAAYYGHEDLCTALIAKGADSQARTPLHETYYDLQGKARRECELNALLNQQKKDFDTVPENLSQPLIHLEVVEEPLNLPLSEYHQSAFFVPAIPTARKPYGALGAEWIQQHETALSGNSSSDETSVQNKCNFVAARHINY